jgi:hypothetical protein
MLYEHRAIIGITLCKGIMAATESTAMLPSAHQDEDAAVTYYLTWCQGNEGDGHRERLSLHTVYGVFLSRPYASIKY